MNKNVYLILFFASAWNIVTAQELREFKQPGMFSETEIYKDKAGVSYSDLVTFRFKSKMVGTSNNRSVVSLYEIQRSEFRELLGEISKEYGRFDIIKLHPDKLWGDTLRVHRRTGKIVGVIDLSQIYQLKFDRPVPHDSIAYLLRRFDDIEYAEGPFVGYTTSVEPNDHGFHQNSPKNPEPYRWSFDALDAPLAWGLTKGSSSIRIGIHDVFNNWINILHPELVNKVVWIHPTISSDNTYGGHGIQVAGVAGAETNNSDGIASLGWNTSLMLAPWYISSIGQLTDNGADIINFSWINLGGNPTYIQSLQNVIEYALQNGVILIAAAGNGPSTVPNLPRIVFPAAFNFGSLGRVLAVSATWVENGTEDFITGWNYSPGTDPINNPGTAFIDFSATGANILGLHEHVYNATQHIWAGTSFAAPKVAAIAALILSVNSTITPNNLFDILHATSEKIGANSYDTNGWNQYMGYGRVNAYQALKYTIENYGGLLGADGETVFITEDFNIASGKTLTIASGTELLLSGNLHINSQADLIVEPGVTIKIDPGKSITVDGTLLAIGTQADPIRFVAGGSSRWDRVRLTGSSSNSDIRWAVFEGGEYGLYAEGTGHQIRNSAFRHNYYGLWLNSVSGTTLTNSVIENNTYEGLLVFDSGHSGNSISYNTITGNGQAGVYLYNSELRDFHGNVIETNNTRGVEVLAGSNLFMQEYLGNPPNDKGLNRVNNNSSHQVYITHSSRAFLGDSWFSTTNAGHNSVFHTSGPGTNRKYIYNLAVTGPGYSGTPYNILAQHSYWDLYPSSGMFHGPVDYTNYLWGSDPTTGSGAGSGQTPQQSIQSGHHGTIVHVLSAGMSGALASSYENPENALQALALKQRMMELRDLLASDEWHPHNARRLNELYTLSLLDTGDLLQEAGNVEVTLTTWAERGSGMNSTYRDEEQVKLAIETALLIQVKQSLRAGDYARTAALITGASPLIENADHRMALMKNAISVYAYHGQHEAALDVLRQVRAIEPEKEVAAWYDAPNLRPVEVWLTDASKEKRPGGGAADLLAQVQYYGATESAAASGGFSLGSNYPNPFNPSTIIPFEVPADSRVHIEVYDLLGRLVTTLSNDMYQAGAHQVVWDARASASGVYLIRAVIEPQQVIYNRRQFTRTVTLLK